MPRLTIRRLMILVACVALSIWTADRVHYFRFWAMMHRMTEARMRSMLAQTEAEIFRCKDPASVHARWQRSGFEAEALELFVRDDTELRRRAATLRKMVAHHAEMRRQYVWACWTPWRTVRVDPGPDW